MQTATAYLLLLLNCHLSRSNCQQAEKSAALVQKRMEALFTVVHCLLVMLVQLCQKGTSHVQ